MEALRLELSLPATVDALEIDFNDGESIDSVISKSKVLLSTAGPFAKIGSPIVASCVRCGTHYCDITGEGPWVQKMISQHHEAALGKKLKIVNCCGFDCIPSDLGTQMMVEHLFSKGDDVMVEEVRLNVLDTKGEASGGTIASVMNILESTPLDQLQELGNPYLLNPRDPVTQKAAVPPAASSAVQRAAQDIILPGYDSVAKIWTAPYFMQGIDTRVVNRSNAVQGWRYGEGFLFSERLRVANPFVAALVSMSMAAAGILLLIPPVRALLKSVLYKPGEGPSEAARNAGFFKIGLWARARDRSTGETILSRGSVEAFNGDPGYKQTAKMVAESALCLAFDSADLPSSYGVLTPAAAMGAVLRQRLHAKGILFSVQEP